MVLDVQIPPLNWSMARNPVFAKLSAAALVRLVRDTQTCSGIFDAQVFLLPEFHTVTA